MTARSWCRRGFAGPSRPTPAAFGTWCAPPLPSALRGAPLACPPLTCLCTHPGQLTREYGVEPSRALFLQIGLLWTKGYLAHDDTHVPEDARVRVKKLVEEVKAAIAEHEG